jgi:hypothetical protein
MCTALHNLGVDVKADVLPPLDTCEINGLEKQSETGMKTDTVD